MNAYLKTVFVFAHTQLRRSFRDPMTLAVLFGIPILLLVLFGAFLSNTNNISLRVAIVNNSSEQFAGDFAKSLGDVDVLKLPDESPTLDQARQQMQDKELDGIIELPPGFGAVGQQNHPVGTLKIYYDSTNTQTGDIVASVMQSVVDHANKQIADIRLPLDIEREPLNVDSGASVMDNVFAIFAGIAIMMVGVFGVASVIPYDKKGGYLRRLHATPLKPSQFMLGTMLNYAAIGLMVLTVMTLWAVTMFDLGMRGDWLVYVLFIVASLVMMLGFGLAVGGIAKNTTQADLYGQIVFLASMALGGVWVPLVFMPELIQNFASLLPLTAIIDGIRAITADGASFAALVPQLLVIAAWALITFVAGARLFRWE